jgi:hypothetical protein
MAIICSGVLSYILTKNISSAMKSEDFGYKKINGRGYWYDS